MNRRVNWKYMPQTRMVITLAVISFAMAAVHGGTAAAQGDRAKELRLLTAVGSSEVRVPPDLAEVRLGVETEAPTARQARDENATRLSKVVDALKALEMPERAIETAVFQIYPVRRFEDERDRGEPPIVAYRVTNIVTIRTDRFDIVPRIIDDSVGAGANRVDAVSFVLRNEAGPRQKALTLAVANAKANAAAMARELGVTLVRVQSIGQGGVGVLQPPIFGRSAAAEAAAPTPVFPGAITVSASVTLSYLIR